MGIISEKETNVFAPLPETDWVVDGVPLIIRDIALCLSITGKTTLGTPFTILSGGGSSVRPSKTETCPMSDTGIGLGETVSWGRGGTVATGCGVGVGGGCARGVAGGTGVGISVSIVCPVIRLETFLLLGFFFTTKSTTEAKRMTATELILRLFAALGVGAFLVYFLFGREAFIETLESTKEATSDAVQYAMVSPMTRMLVIAFFVVLMSLLSYRLGFVFRKRHEKTHI